MNTLHSMPNSPDRRGRWRFIFPLLLALLLALGGAFVTAAWAQSGGHGGAGMMFGGSPERAGRMLDRMLDGVSASDPQRSQIKQIAQVAAVDLKSQHEATRGLRERAMQLFSAPNVDANAAEALRQQMSSQHDQSSRRMMQAMLDISRVLTPEQRVKLGERLKQRSAQRAERMQRMQRQQPPR